MGKIKPLEKQTAASLIKSIFYNIQSKNQVGPNLKKWFDMDLFKVLDGHIDAYESYKITYDYKEACIVNIGGCLNLFTYSEPTGIGSYDSEDINQHYIHILAIPLLEVEIANNESLKKVLEKVNFLIFSDGDRKSIEKYFVLKIHPNIDLEDMIITQDLLYKNISSIAHSDILDIINNIVYQKIYSANKKPLI